MKRNKKYFLLTALTLFFLSLPAFLLALQVDWPPSPVGRDLSTSTVLHEFVAYLYEWGVAIGGLVVFVVLVFAGFQYLTSTGNPAKMADAMSRIKAAVLGLVLLISSWLILSIINPELVTLREITFDPPDQDPEADFFATTTVPTPCYHVVLYTEPNYDGATRTITFDGPSRKVQENDPFYWHPDGFESGKAFMKNEEDEIVEGGYCRIIFYQKTGWWRPDPCGSQVNQSQLPSPDFRHGTTREHKITCFEIVRILPESIPSLTP